MEADIKDLISYTPETVSNPSLSIRLIDSGYESWGLTSITSVSLLIVSYFFKDQDLS